MSQPLRVLILEDRPADALLVVHELRRAGFEPDWSRVEAEPDYLAHLEPTLGVILADYQLPQFDALKALHRLQERGLDIPFIVVTGVLGDEAAVECLRRGAADYLLKDRLARLGPAVAHALEQKRVRDDKRRVVAALRLSEGRKGAILEAAPDGIITIDAEGRILEFNPAAEAMFGYPRGAVLGRYMAELIIPPALRERHRRGLEHYLATGESSVLGRRFEMTAMRAGGVEFPADLAITLIRPGEEGDPPMFTGYIRDMTEQKRAETELRDAKEAAEAASRAKDQFLAILSHELRTPLTPVLLAISGGFDESPAGADLSSTLAMIRRNVELEARLIDDLLDITQIIHGKMRFNWKMVDVHDAIYQAVSTCRGEIQARELQLTLDLAASKHHIRADAARLQQVFWNLIKNAVKFSPGGGKLVIRSRNRPGSASGSAGPLLTVEVSDTGIGIEPEVFPKIFRVFEQGDSTLTRRFGGLGLGLALSRSIVEAHGGRLTATSAGKDRGATFTIELATELSPTPELSAPLPTPGESSHPHALRILLIEDNKDTLQYLASILGQRRHTVRTAADLPSALELVALEDFDLVIADIGLPDGSGLELMHEIKKTRGFPGIALSGFGSDEDIELSKAAGFATHLIKPVDLQTLEATIRQVVPPRWTTGP